MVLPTDPAGSAYPSLLCTEEAARLLRVHVNTVKVLCRSGKLPAMKIGRQWRIEQRAVVALLQASQAAAPQRSALETLVRSAQHLNAQLSLDAAMRAVCTETRRTLDLPAAWINLYDPQRNVLDFAVTDGMPPEFAVRYRSPARALLDERMQRSGPLIVFPDVQALSDIPNARLYADLDIRTVANAVMLYQSRLVGVLSVVTFGQVRQFSPDELTLLQGLANQAALAIANARLFEGLERELAERTRAEAALLANRQQLQTLSRRLVEVQEDERRALSRDLHDTSGQSITAVKLGLGALKREPGCPAALKSRVDELLALADSVSEDLHRLAVTLRPASLDRYGLVPAVEQLLNGFRQQSGLHVDLEVQGPDGPFERLPDYVETVLYRIIQESLTNIARYAQAQSAAVMLQRRRDSIQVIVEDDGRGFDVGEALSSGRLGLLGMRERAEMLGGTLEVESSPGRGTTIYATVPAPWERAELAPLAAQGPATPALQKVPRAGAALPEARAAEAAELVRAKALSDALLDMTASIARCSDADEILRLVLAQSAQAIGRQNAHIAVLSRGRWRLRYAYRDSLAGQRIADLDAPAFDWVERNRQVLVVNDTAALAPDDPLRLEARHVKSYASIPLTGGDRLLGVLSFVDYATAAPFYPSEVEFLNRLAALVAVILENAQLHEIETRQRAELARHVDELQVILDLLPVGIGISNDRECKTGTANPALAKMLGVPAGANPSLSGEEAAREAWYRVVDPAGTPLTTDELPMQLAAQGTPVHDMVIDVLRADGQRLTLLSNAVPLRGPDGSAQGSVAAFVDITERRQAEARVQRQKAIQEGISHILASALTSATEEELGRVALTVAEQVTGSKFGFLGELNAEGRLEDIAISNPGWQACRMETPVGHHVVPGGFLVHGIYGRVLLDGQALIANDPGLHPDRVGTPEGHPALTAFLGVPLVSHGETIGMIGLGNRAGGYTAEDLAAAEALATPIVEALGRKRAEERLRQSDAMARDLIRNAPSGICEIDFPTGRFLSVNDAMCRILSYSRDELLTMTAFDLLDDASKALFADRLRHTLSGEKVDRAVEYRVQTRDGREIYVGLSVRFTYQGGRPDGALIIAHDVTERRHAAAQLADAATRFELLAGTASLLLAAGDPQAVIDELCRSVMRYLDAQVFFNFLVDAQSGRLRLNAYGGISVDEAAQITWLDYGQAGGETVCGSAARAACPIVVEHIVTTMDPRAELVKGYGLRAYAAHPLLGENGRVLGTLSFGTRTRDTFSPADLSLMKAIADQIAVAVLRMRR